jgi:hypothetical protein
MHTPLTTREFFAAAALQGLLAGRNHNATAYNTEELAKVSVECADKLLLALADCSAPNIPVTSTPIDPEASPESMDKFNYYA